MLAAALSLPRLGISAPAGKPAPDGRRLHIRHGWPSPPGRSRASAARTISGNLGHMSPLHVPENGGLDRIKATSGTASPWRCWPRAGPHLLAGTRRESHQPGGGGTYNWSRSRSLGAGTQRLDFRPITLDSGGFAVPEGQPIPRRICAGPFCRPRQRKGAFGLSSGRQTWTSRPWPCRLWPLSGGRRHGGGHPPGSGVAVRPADGKRRLRQLGGPQR